MYQMQKVRDVESIEPILISVLFVSKEPDL